MHASNVTRPGRPGRLAPAWLEIALVAASTLIGCGEEGPSRVSIAGSITLDGKPLPSGTILFAPLDGRAAALAEVKDGTYKIASSKGPAPGHYQVEVRAEAPTGKRIPNPDAPEETIEEVRELVPSRYNTKTELKVEVKPGTENSFDFPLSGREIKTKTRR